MGKTGLTSEQSAFQEHARRWLSENKPRAAADAVAPDGDRGHA